MTKTLQIALFSYISTYDPSIDFKHPVVFQKYEDSIGPQGYVRVSEWIEITFPLLDQASVISSAKSAIAKQKAVVVEDYQRKLKEVEKLEAKLTGG